MFAKQGSSVSSVDSVYGARLLAPKGKKVVKFAIEADVCGGVPELLSALRGTNGAAYKYWWRRYELSRSWQDYECASSYWRACYYQEWDSLVWYTTI